MRNKLFFRIEELILVLLVILNLLDFTEMLNSDFDYIKKVISFILMGYLLYQASMSKQFFGIKNENFDFLLIFAMFSMVIVRNAVTVAKTAEEGFFTPFFNLLISNSFLFEIIGLYLGTIILIILAIYSANKIKIKSPSLLIILHEKNSESVWQKAFINYLLFIAFFLFVFNLVFEWLTIAIDAPIVSIGLIAYLFLAWRKHNFEPESALFKIGNFGEKFYESFVTHFKYKDKLKLGIAGMLILHLMTDLGVFIIPAITGVRDALYGTIFSENHLTIWQLALSVGRTRIELMLYFIQYLFSTVGFAMLMIIPVLVWKNLYYKKNIFLSKTMLAIFFVSMFSFLLTPIYKVVPLVSNEFYGADIISFAKLINVYFSLPLILVLFLIFYFIIPYYKKFFSIISIILSTGFFAWYIINYFMSSLNYFSSAVMYLLSNNFFYLGIHFFIFLMLIIIFYFVGFWFYLRSLIHGFTIR